MTMLSFGRVTPIHIDMLRLAGYTVEWDKRDIRPAATDEASRKEMKAGRKALRIRTGRDFGYDLAAWREFLLSENGDDFGYRHPYAFQNVDRAVQRATRSRNRKRLVANLSGPDAPEREGPQADKGKTMTLAELEKRLTALEDTVKDLVARQKSEPVKQEPWWVTGAGRFANDPVFDEIVRLGREYRESLHPDYKQKKRKKKRSADARS